MTDTPRPALLIRIDPPRIDAVKKEEAAWWSNPIDLAIYGSLMVGMLFIADPFCDWAQTLFR